MSASSQQSGETLPLTGVGGKLHKWLQSRWFAASNQRGGLLGRLPWPLRRSVGGGNTAAATESAALTAAKTTSLCSTPSNRQRRRLSSVERVAYMWGISEDDARELCDNVENQCANAEESDIATTANVSMVARKHDHYGATAAATPPLAWVLKPLSSTLEITGAIRTVGRTTRASVSSSVRPLPFKRRRRDTPTVGHLAAV
jgi:hypothetical protein